MGNHRLYGWKKKATVTVKLTKLRKIGEKKVVRWSREEEMRGNE